MDAFWIILVGSLVAVSCGLLGVFLILRKMAMVGDAISHSVLPGIIIAYLISGSDASLPMLAGAALMGVLATLLIELFHRKGKLQTDASIGLTFTWLFAIGVIMASRFTREMHIDVDCILYGEILFTPQNRWYLNGLDLGPKNVWILGVTLLLVLTFIMFGYRGLKLTTFDENYAAAIGIKTAFWHYTLMSLVSLTTVASFDAVGAILVVAFLIVPGATAYLLTDSLRTMLVLSAAFGIAAAAGGYYLAYVLDSSIAGSMTVVAGAIFLVVLIGSPKYGLLRLRT